MKEERYNFLVNIDYYILLFNKEISIFYYFTNIFNDITLDNLSDDLK